MRKTLIIRFFIYGVLLSLIEIFLWYYLVIYSYKKYPVYETGIGWGLYMHFLFRFFIILIILVNMIISFFGINWKTFTIILFLLLIFNHLASSPIDYRPNRILFYLCLSNSLVIFSVLLNYFGQRIFKKLQNKS